MLLPVLGEETIEGCGVPPHGIFSQSAFVDWSYDTGAGEEGPKTQK